MTSAGFLGILVSESVEEFNGSKVHEWVALVAYLLLVEYLFSVDADCWMVVMLRGEQLMALVARTINNPIIINQFVLHK